jgi:hypothetical protein
MPENIIPDNFLYSQFRNTLPYPVTVPFGSGGFRCKEVQAGEVFNVPGDPRIFPQIPGMERVAEILFAAVRRGDLEICQTIAPFVNDNTPDGKSVGTESSEGDLYLTRLPLDETVLASRVLPVITPEVVWETGDTEILVDWSSVDRGTREEKIHDRFLVAATRPDGQVTHVKCGSDLQYICPVTIDGDYKFIVTLIAADGREQAGTEVTVTVG